MAKRFKESRRIFFPKGRQRLFLQRVSKELNLNHYQLAVLFKVSPRTLSDWKREKFSMPENPTKRIIKKINNPLLKRIVTKDRYWYVGLGARKGGLAHYKKYGCIGGDEKKRRKMWQKWWLEKGRFIDRDIFKRKSIKKPLKDVKLAEFIGIIIGDGGLTNRQLTITLHCRDDFEYSKNVVKLIKELFGLKPSIYLDKKNSVNNIVISRTELVDFLSEKHEMKIGNKIRQSVDMPMWVKRKKKYRIACLRGLVDTDGSVFTHSYKVNNKMYHYKKMAFTSLSAKLINTVYKTMESIDLHPRITKDRKDIRLDSKEDLKKYFEIVSSNNPKHINRYFGVN